jgi:hypothetical protein
MHDRAAQRMAIQRCEESRLDRLSRVLEAMDAGDGDRFVFRLHRRVRKEPRDVNKLRRETCERGPSERLVTRTASPGRR